MASASPSGDGGRSVQPVYTVEQLLDLSEEWLTVVAAAPEDEAERLAAKCPVPFVLLP